MKINIQAIISSSTKAQLQGLVSRGIKAAELDDNGRLIFTLTDNSTVDIGRVEGDPGADGASIVAITKGQTVGDTTTYIITMSDGNEFYFEVKTAKGDPGEPGEPGADGADGEDGVSPAVSISSITGGHRITIADAAHPTGQSFDVMDGEDGAPGTPGSPGTPGADGITPTIGNNGNWFLGTTDTGKPSRGEQGVPGQDGADGLTTSVTVNGETITQSGGNINIGSPTRIKINGVEQTVDAGGYANIPIASAVALGVLRFASADGFVASSSGNLRASERTLSQYTSAAGTLNIGKGTLEAIKTDLVNRALLGNVKTAMDAVAVAGAQYFLGQQSAVNITMPTAAEVGQEILVCFTSGATAATLTCNLTGFDFVPKANKTSWIKFTCCNASGDWLVETKEG